MLATGIKGVHAVRPNIVDFAPARKPTTARDAENHGSRRADSARHRLHDRRDCPIRRLERDLEMAGGQLSREVLFSRAATSLVGVSLVILPYSGFAVFRTKRLGSHLMRGISQASSQAFLLIAFGLMPLASAVAINFSAPLFATVAAVFFLKEPVGAIRWGALIVGFIGVLLVAGPGADAFQTGSLFALCNAVLFGTVTVGVRGMTATESAETLTLYQMVVLTTVFTAALPFGFLAPTWGDLVAMILNGLGNALGQFWWTRRCISRPPRRWCRSTISRWCGRSASAS
jgi:hypothetical protein